MAVAKALGRRVEERDAQLLRICNSESSSPYSLIQLEYQTRNGERYLEELPAGAVGDYAMRMYMESCRISDQRSLK